MAAKPPHALLIDCPPSRNDGGGGGGTQRREWRDVPACQKACMAALLFLVVAAVVTGVVCLAVFLAKREQLASNDPVFTVTITGVAGLDVLLPPPPPPPPSAPSPAPAAPDAADGYYDDDYSYATATLSPVFDLVFQIDNTRNGNYDACVPGLSRAEVSYGDAFLAGGSVPPSCAGTKRASGPVAARAWGENVDVPVFLRAQLAAELAAGGDASVDVKVTMPEYCENGSCGGTAVLSCKAMIGGAASPACRLDYL